MVTLSIVVLSVVMLNVVMPIAAAPNDVIISFVGRNEMSPFK
jgi:hypothetical protein